jgi:hypothetical protein
MPMDGVAADGQAILATPQLRAKKEKQRAAGATSPALSPQPSTLVAPVISEGWLPRSCTTGPVFSPGEIDGSPRDRT